MKTKIISLILVCLLLTSCSKETLLVTDQVWLWEPKPQSYYEELKYGKKEKFYKYKIIGFRGYTVIYKDIKTEKIGEVSADAFVNCCRCIENCK
jgi:hypothetical protein